VRAVLIHAPRLTGDGNGWRTRGFPSGLAGGRSDRVAKSRAHGWKRFTQPWKRRTSMRKSIGLNIRLVFATPAEP